MFSFKSIVLIVAALAIGAECSGVPAVAAAPLVTNAHVGYTHAVPQNIPPYAAQVNVVSRALSPLVTGPAIAGPVVQGPIAARFAAPLSAAYYGAAAPYALPAAAGYAAPAAYAAPVAYSAPAAYAAPTAYATPTTFAAPAPVAYAGPAAYAAPAAYGAAYPYAAAASLVRSPFGVAPAYVR